MDRYAVLVFHDQPLTDEQQCAFSRNFGELEMTAGGQMTKPSERRLDRWRSATSPTSTQTGQVARPRRQSAHVWAGQPAVALGCVVPCDRGGVFVAVGAGRAVRRAATPNTPICGPHMTRWMTKPRREIEDLVTEHSIAFSRGVLGFDDYGEGNDDKVMPGAAPAGADASGDRAEVAVSCQPISAVSSVGRCPRLGRLSAT